MKRAGQAGGALVALVLVAGLAAPKFNANRYRATIQNALEKALERKVEIGAIHFNLLTGPGFTVSGVTIGEDPAIGIEPIAYVENLVAIPRLWSLWTGHLVFSSLRLEDAQLNLSRTQLQPGQYRWNFERLLRPSLVAAFPHVSMRRGRINFKAENLKSVVYLLDSDLDISPPSSSAAPWRVRFEGKPCRTDRPARGSGVFSSRGAWYPSTGTLDLDLTLDRSELGDIIALVRGEDIGMHGFVSGKAHVSGPPRDLAIHGRLTILDVHGWDQSVPRGESWPLDIAGRWNLPGQQLKIEAGVANKLSVHYMVERYFTEPKWGVTLGFRDFSVEPLAALARHLGAPLPENMKLHGRLDGVIGYTGWLEGEVAFRDIALSMPSGPSLTTESARVLISKGEARLLPARVDIGSAAGSAPGDEARIEASYTIGSDAPAFQLSTAGLDVKSIPGVPLLSGLSGGRFAGDLRLNVGVWTGSGTLTDATLNFPGFSAPVAIHAADARIDGARVWLRNLRLSAGGIVADGEYRYEPGAPRPHRFRLSASELDVEALEKLLLPTLSHPGRLFGFGKSAPPDWLKRLRADGTIQTRLLHAGTVELRQVRTRVVWDGARAALPDLDASLGAGSLTSRVLIDLSGRAPAYQAFTHLAAIPWKTGRVDADAILETSGIGPETLARMRSTGTFSGRGVLEEFPAVSGHYELRGSGLGPRLNFTDLHFSGAGEVLTGKAWLQDDGTLLVQAANGGRQMRVPLQ